MATSTVPAPAVAALIEIASRATLPPMIPCIATAPAPVLIVRSRLVLASSELTVAVELKVTLVLFASASTVMSPARVTGPVKAIAPPAVSVVTRLPVRVIPLSPIRVIDPEVADDPKVIVPVPVPSSRVRVSSVPALLIAPVMLIFPPLVLISKFPSLMATVPVTVKSPPSPDALSVSTLGLAPEKVVLPVMVTLPVPKS